MSFKPRGSSHWLATALYTAVVVLGFTGILPCTLFGGQSLVLTPTPNPITVQDPVYPANQSYRVEFQIHDWILPAAGLQPAIFTLYGLGAGAWFYPDGTVAVESIGASVVERQPCFVGTKGMTNALIRIQRDVANMRLTCESWSHDGRGYNTQSDSISKLGNPGYSGGVLGGNVTLSLGFLRVFTTLVPVGSKPPTTGDAGDYTDLKFDGDLADSSGHGHGGTIAVTNGISAGPNQSPFTATTKQVPVALPKTFGAPFWTNSTSLRAGFPAKLDGSASYTLADGSPAISYSWKQLSGPSTVIWQDQNTATPTISGLIFGPYSFELDVTDASGRVATATLETGAVATDANGVVVNANPAADAIFGPMIAFGQNPWSWADERNLAMENLQKDTYAKPPVWGTPAESQTVSYQFYGITPALTTITADITADTLTIPVANAATLDLSSFPTQIVVSSIFGPEIVRICSASGNTLTVCYDGRGFHAGHLWDKPPTPWAKGTGLWQATVTGNGTHFLTTMCSLGPGYTVAGSAVSSDGSVTMTAGSPLVTGIGTKWDGTQNSLAIAVNARHGGLPFTFFAYVVNASGTKLTLSRPFPADADNGAYSYHIFSDQRNVVLHYTRSDSADGSIYFSTAGCESDDKLFLDGPWDMGQPIQLVPASPYTYMDGAGSASDFSPNYYDLGLAHYAFYYRSGMQQALKSARDVEDFWMHSPEIAQGDAAGPPRSRSILGVFAAAVLDGDRAGNWPGLRSFARYGSSVAAAKNCEDDPRETAYGLSWLALAAQFDPDSTQRDIFKASLADAYARDNACKGSDNSFPSAAYWNPAVSPAVVVTKGSQVATAATGTFPSNACYGVARGTAIAVNGSALLTSITGSFVPPAGTSSIVIGGTRDGVRYDLSTQFDFLSPGSLTLAALWPGDSGTVSWMIANNDGNPMISVATIATGPSDSDNFGQIFGCTLTDSTHMVLHRPWTGVSGKYGFFSYNLVGKGTQPFMMGIKTLQMRYAGQTYTPYQDLSVALADWIAQVGFDPAAKAISYGRGFPQCEPVLTESGITDVLFRNAGCMENSNDPYGVVESRSRNSEAQNAMTVMYLANPTEANRAIGDMFYGAAYGAKGYTANGYWSDGITASNLDNGSLGGYKWPGFFFGVGMAHQWPAARLGGVEPPSYRTVAIDFDAALSAAAQIVVTAPSGAISTFPCGNTSPCAVAVDDRQGSHWYQIQYLSETGEITSQAAPDLLAERPPKRAVRR